MRPTPRYFRALLVFSLSLLALLSLVAVASAVPERLSATPQPVATTPTQPRAALDEPPAPPDTTTTTTSAPEPEPVRAQQAAPAVTVTAPEPAAPEPEPVPAGYGEVNGYPCGVDLPPCSVLRRESKGDPLIWNGVCYAPVGWEGSRSPCGGSTASGLWQFLRSTWAGFGGYLNAADAPASVQNDRAREVWAGGRGCSHWLACG